MPYVTIESSGQTILAKEGAVLMDVLIEAGLPIASSCDGEGVCGMCRITLVSFKKDPPAIDSFEKSLIEKNSLSDNQRISCQIKVTGDLTISTNYW